ncbi:MAG: DUF2334 domain-containing protein [Minisyncoccales bacterium]
MKFVIRDDDLSYFNSISDIERVYHKIFDLNIPVGFSLVPFVKPTSDIWFPKNCQIPKEEKEYPISENKELVHFLKNHPLIEILQHGCTHESKNGIFEYEERKRLEEKTKKGKEELERTFEREIKIFVPPHDRISNQGILAVEKLKMNIIRGKGFNNFIFRPSFFLNFFKMLFHRTCAFKKENLPHYPYTINFKKHKEAFSSRLEGHSQKQLFSFLYFIFKKKGNFVVVNHLNIATEERMKILFLLIQEAKKLGFSFVKPSKLFE